MLSKPTFLLRRMLGWFVREDKVSPERSFRFLCRQIAHEFESVDRNCVIAVTPASTEGESSSHALMLAATLDDEIGGKVLLVDGAFSKRRSLSAAFDAKQDAGFAELCKGLEEEATGLFKPTNRKNVHFLPAGKTKTVLKKGRARQVIDSLRNSFDYIVVSQEATTTDARNLEILRQVDLLLLLVEEGKTRSFELDEQEDAMKNIGITDIRIVLVLPEKMAVHRSEME